MSARAFLFSVGVLLALLGVGGAPFAQPARADEAPGAEAPVANPPVKAPAEDPEDDERGAKDPAGTAEEAPADEGKRRFSPDALEKLLFGSPWTLGSRILLTFLPALIGAVILLVLLVRRLERRSAARAGLSLPETAPRIEPTVPFQLPQALGLAVLAYLLLQLIAASVAKARPDLVKSIPMAFAVIATVTVPFALLVLIRRARLRGGVERPTRRTLLRGYLTYCAGTAAALAITYPWAAFLLELGEKPRVQDIIERAADPARPELLWMTALFAVVVAPFTEEVVFRGLLFPATRKWLGGGRRGFWLAAVIVSLAFAASHEGPLSFAMGPLFGLAMVLTWSFDRTDSLLVPILGHSFFNASTVIPMLIARSEGLL